MAVKLSNNFFVEIDRQVLNTRAVQKEAALLAENKFNAAKQEMISEFENHPVSQEIKSGPLGPNSLYIDGVNNAGNGNNLFSFIGFDDSETPVDDVVRFLEQSITMVKRPELNYKKNLFRFRVRYPTTKDEQLAKAAPMPRGTSINWIYAIERGISGINSYFFDRNKTFSSSSSGPAIQATSKDGKSTKLRSGARFKTVKSYFTGIVNKFTRKLGGG